MAPSTQVSGHHGPAGHAAPPDASAGRIQELLDQFGALSEGGPGVTRLAYTPLERSAHDAFAAFMGGLGLDVWTDPAGNTVAQRPGTSAGAPAIVTGSHLDSVPAGGRYDGTAGVVAAMEVASGLVAEGVRHRHPLRFVAFAAEEGARFGQPCLGSRFAAGRMTGTDLMRRDAAGVTLGDAMRSVGLDPERAVRTPWTGTAAFLELHVEQGGVLEATGTQVGLVDLVSGSTRLWLDVTGRAAHSGATPMDLRADALAAAAEIVLAAESIARHPARRGARITVGRLEVEPGSLTTIPGRVRMSVDVRDTDSDRQRIIAVEVVRAARAICDRRKTAVTAGLIGDSSPVVLPVWLRRLAAATCHEAKVSFRVLSSGAGHDAQTMQSAAPAAILFVPSRAGLSHVPEEWTSARDLAVGASVLRSLLLRVDRELAGRPAARAETGR